MEHPRTPKPRALNLLTPQIFYFFYPTKISDTTISLPRHEQVCLMRQRK